MNLFNTKQTNAQTDGQTDGQTHRLAAVAAAATCYV